MVHVVPARPWGCPFFVWCDSARELFNLVAPDCGSWSLVSRGTSLQTAMNPVGREALEICLLWKWHHIKASLTQFSMLYNFDGVARWSQTPLTHVPAGWFAYYFLWWRSTPFGYWNSPVGQNRFYHGMPDLNGFATTSCMFFNCNFKGLYRMRILKQWISMVFH